MDQPFYKDSFYKLQIKNKYYVNSIKNAANLKTFSKLTALLLFLFKLIKNFLMNATKTAVRHHQNVICRLSLSDNHID
ncbi:hypothetical protein EUX48_03015 [Haemophilus haemolyticus]|uniref:Uncharacterized protein n=1 Tax=Haemophilus haemolyticus TaxID=726 RepID=A0A502LJZ0_HAEHA|nr:hypothetical protein EUX48_03015 [Haemophilus haemolyticus]